MAKNQMILRKDYISYLEGWRDNTDVVKIITGVRRCGKSTLMKQYAELLLSDGVDESNVIFMNFESSEFYGIGTYSDLSEYLKTKMAEGIRYYLFFDEIQRVEGWERTINSISVDYDADVYITGSNAHLLSSELATFISGRYVEVKMLPLSFSEFLEMHPTSPDISLEQRFSQYIWSGSMPLIDPEDTERTADLLQGIYSTIIRKDIAPRQEIKSISQLDEITTFLFSNLGSITNCNNISTVSGIHPSTVKKCISALEDAYLVYRCRRFDIRGKKILDSKEKYYVVDTGMRNAVLENSKGLDISRQLENIVYLELRRRGYKVSVGCFKDYEVDFTAVKDGTYCYFQVCQTLMGADTAEREVRSLDIIEDHFQKTILTMDRLFSRPDNGIRVINLIDWLINDN